MIKTSVMNGSISFVIKQHKLSLKHNTGNSTQILMDLRERIACVERNISRPTERQELQSEIDAGKEYLRQVENQRK